jgi:hypothetical protein
MKVVYAIYCKEQVQMFSDCTDPLGKLMFLDKFEVEDIKIHNWHTTYKLKGINGNFNSTHFKEVLQ